MAEFYGLNIFLAETSATSGGLDSLLEPVGPNLTRATYSIYTDSGGTIPAFIKNTGSQIGIRKIFAAIRKQARNPKYKAEG